MNMNMNIYTQYIPPTNSDYKHKHGRGASLWRATDADQNHTEEYRAQSQSQSQ